MELKIEYQLELELSQFQELGIEIGIDFSSLTLYAIPLLYEITYLHKTLKNRKLTDKIKFFEQKTF